MRSSSKPVFPILNSGQEVKGCWEGHSYKVVSILGGGANGIVYLVKDGQSSLKAMKVSPDLAGLTAEYRMLVFLKQCQGIRNMNTVPKAYEIDDFRSGKRVYHFLILDYCHGDNLSKYIGKMTEYDAAVVGAQVSSFLSCLHKAGFVYGDLKPGNLLYDFLKKKVFIIDYGSVSLIGNDIKQYTPGYDRQSWDSGDRTADEKYDMFSMGLLLGILLCNKTHPRDRRSLRDFIDRVSKTIVNPALKKIVVNALLQKTKDCNTMSDELTSILHELRRTADKVSEMAFFVNFVGLVTVVSFILTVLYYYF